MTEQNNSVRLARLEASFEFIKDLLKEIRDEVKGLPVKEDYDKLNERITALEKAQTTILIKTGIAAGILGTVGGLIIKMLA